MILIKISKSWLEYILSFYTWISKDIKEISFYETADFYYYTTQPLEEYIQAQEFESKLTKEEGDCREEFRDFFYNANFFYKDELTEYE